MYELILLGFIAFVSGLNFMAISRNHSELHVLRYCLDIIRQDVEKLRSGICQLEDLIRRECNDIDVQVNNTKILVHDMVKKIDLLLVKLDSSPKTVGQKNDTSEITEKVNEVYNITYKMAYIVNKLNPEFWDCNCHKKLKDKMKCESSIDKNLKQLEENHETN